MKVVLETERLLLRHFTEDDANALWYMESEPDVLRYAGRGPLADVDAYRNKIQFCLSPVLRQARRLRCLGHRRKGKGGFHAGVLATGPSWHVAEPMSLRARMMSRIGLRISVSLHGARDTPPKSSKHWSVVLSQNWVRFRWLPASRLTTWPRFECWRRRGCGESGSRSAYLERTS